MQEVFPIYYKEIKGIRNNVFYELSLMQLINVLIFFGLFSIVQADEKINLNDRKEIYQPLTAQKLLHKDRQLVRMVHVCNLIIEKRYYPVIEVKEHVRGAQIPRIVLHVLILDSSLNLVNKIYHDSGSGPLYCKDNKLYWHGFLNFDFRLTEDNITTFTEGGKKMVTSNMDINNFPPQKSPQ